MRLDHMRLALRLLLFFRESIFLASGHKANFCFL